MATPWRDAGTAYAPTRRRTVVIVAATLAVLAVAVGVPPAHSAARPAAASSPPASRELAALGWVWPADSFRLSRPFVAPVHAYARGHRGVDLRLDPGASVRAPADGLVAFAGSVAGRGILTIDHGDGLVTTLEPVQSDLAAGSPVSRGEGVATLGVGGHAEPGHLHFGVRLHGEYINPLLLLGGVPRAVLLPCCD